ncbi:MAG: class I SAM-dependent methyltransferase [Acidobacteriota bacterium]
MRKANYGIDAPTVLRNLAIGAIVCFLLSAFVARGFLGPALGFTFAASMMLWSSLVGKFRARDSLLNAIPWSGNERVLDVGCGHGLLLIGAAKRLTAGQAVGIDIWQSVDQAGNSAEATGLNAELEGVVIEVRDGDARHIPFDDETFDVVVSSLALHNIYNGDEREGALREIARVTRPGGHVAIMDIRHSYTPSFERMGFTVVKKWMTFLFATPTRSTVLRKGAGMG